MFENDPEIGGRYSVLSYFGLVPAALAGVNVEAMLHRAQVAEQNCAHFDDTASNSGLWMGIAMGGLALHGRDKVTFIVDEPISSFGLWVEQLIAESTGKEGKGVLPVADEPSGTRTSTATTASSPTCAMPTDPTRRPTPRLRPWRRRGIRWP